MGKDVAARTHGKNFLEYVQTDKPITEKNLFVLWVGYIFHVVIFITFPALQLDAERRVLQTIILQFFHCNAPE